ncbi:S53 family peptidase [Streptomyces sp. NRRL F-5126]|uniref:S53 family peptidase n=1 Tax=Streptomyces sp. NRRL F-5126 TaxID=1463857 RepID=UPI0005660A87|nr:S53 family peptidase [Streptomyces sp. NRRL F-5126]
MTSLPLPGSFRDDVPWTERLGPLAADERVDFVVVLRRRAALPRELVEGPGTVTREALAARFGADPQDVSRVRRAVEAAGLTVEEVHEGSRRIRVSGRADAVGALLGTELSAARWTDPRGRVVTHRSRSGSLRVPEPLTGAVVAVLGTDTRPHGRPLLRARPADDRTPRGDATTPAGHTAAPVAYTPPRLAEFYDFPPGTDGTGTTAALVEFGGGYDEAELVSYFAQLGVKPPSIRAVGVAGAANSPGRDENADGEVQLDIEVLGALAPGADLVVHFAPGTARGYVEAVSSAVHADPTPTVLSISWGAPENHWTRQSVAALEEALADAAALGVTVCAAAGDSGSTDGEEDGRPHLDYPGSSPHVLSVGGTTLRLDGRRPAETVWNALAAGGGSTGGGRSATFPPPLWQRGQSAGRRGVPDVAAVADPSTGYRVRVGGKPTTLGGTSAAAPLWAALACRLSQALGTPLGLLPPLLYALEPPPRALRDITAGGNGRYQAAAGWDPCTGLGTPLGSALLAHLRATRGTAP